MKKIFLALTLISLFSCGKKEIQLAQLNQTVVADVKDHSPIYMFFEVTDNDTLVEVNRSNSISSTNWLFNIDKRLPLKLVIPEIQKLQSKKEKSSHKNQASENYFTYMDKNKKTLAFLPFAKTHYQLKKPTTDWNILFFKANGTILFNNQELKDAELNSYLNNLKTKHETELVVGYDQNLSFENYLKNRLIAKEIIITKLGLSIDYSKEFIY